MLDSKKRPAQSINEQPQVMQVGDMLAVSVIPYPDHQFIISTVDVAHGYGVAKTTINSHTMYHKDELVEGLHYIKGNGISVHLPNKQPNAVFWTKAGVIRLGFFIKSERAKTFRDWAEKLVLNKINESRVILPPAPKRNHNRLSQERLISIMADVLRIEDHELRISLASKLMNP